MKHIGTKVIETDRLILRAFKETDAELMFKNWANDDRVTKYLRWLPHENVELTKKLCMIWEDNSKNENNYQWIIILKDENTPIGSIGIVDIDENKKSGEIGFCIGYDWWGKGIIKEALLAVIDYLKPVGFVRIFAIHDVNNDNSGKVLLKCNFEYEGTLRKYVLNNKKNLVDAKMYSIIFNDNEK